MTYLEIAQLITALVQSFNLVWDEVCPFVLARAPHLEPHLDDAIADFDRARKQALDRTGGGA